MKIGDKVIFKYYENIPKWKLGIFEIADIELNSGVFVVKQKTKNNLGISIDIYSKRAHSREEFITLKEYRKQKILKLNNER